MMPSSFCGVSYLEMHLTRHLKISLFLSFAVQMDLSQILKCRHFFGTDLSLGMTLMSPLLQDIVVKLSQSIALPGGKGQKEWVPVQGRKALLQPWGSISPQDAGVLWGAGLPLLN